MPVQRVVERVDAELRPAPVVLDRAALREDRVVLVHQHGVVDLEQEAGVDDRRVLLVQRVGDREDELLLGRVVLVAQPVDACRRDHRQERVGDVHARRAPPGSGRCPARGAGVVLDRAGAEPALRLRAPASSGSLHADPVRDLARERGVVLRVELRERLPVAARRQDRLALERHHALLDPAHALVQVRDPGRLAHLAVVDDVDARLGLAADDVGDRVGQRLARMRRRRRLPRSFAASSRAARCGRIRLPTCVVRIRPSRAPLAAHGTRRRARRPRLLPQLCLR